jgi:hypothetical protein
VRLFDLLLQISHRRLVGGDDVSQAERAQIGKIPAHRIQNLIAGHRIDRGVAGHRISIIQLIHADAGHGK